MYVCGNIIFVGTDPLPELANVARELRTSCVLETFRITLHARDIASRRASRLIIVYKTSGR